MLPKGIRLNNPGNIERGNDKWHGMSAVQLDPRFITFDDPKWGIRAIVRIIMNYQRQNHAVDTVREIISKWAPPVENDTGAYAEHVAKIVGVSPDDQINLKADVLLKLAQGITLHENGKPPEGDNWYPNSTFAEAVNLALT